VADERLLVAQDLEGESAEEQQGAEDQRDQGEEEVRTHQRVAVRGGEDEGLRAKTKRN
jgi:hypothetical protein